MTLGIPDHWLTYLYQFGIGGLFFLGGLIVILKTGACDLKTKADRTWFSALVIGFLALATVYALWIYVSVSTPTKALDGAQAIIDPLLARLR
jgi:hypothetical protein